MTARIEFDWDPEKAATNLAKHKVRFEDAMTVFRDPLHLSCPDPDQSSHDERWITIGLNLEQKMILVVHTYVDIGPDHVYIRIISARKPTKRERRQYE